MGGGGILIYADSEQAISDLSARLAESAKQGQPVGLDTEFYGVDLGARSACGAAKLHLLSLAVKRLPLDLHARGYHLADAWVVPKTHLGPLKPWLQSEAHKAVHNLAVDRHSLQGVGIELRNGINTLAMARFAWPGRARGGTGSGHGYTLDALGDDLLGAGKTETYAGIFRQEITQLRPHTRTRVSRRCVCGDDRCRRRTLPTHAKYEEKEEVTTYEEVHTTQEVPLSDVVPGHTLWERLLSYAAQDAVLALGVYDLALAELRKTRRYMPW